MILVDTSVWIDHFHTPGHPLTKLLQQRQVCTHAMIIGELACGNLTNRTEILLLLGLLPQLKVADKDILAFIDQHKLFGKGLGIVDVHILLVASSHPECRIWTEDKRMKKHADIFAFYEPKTS